MFNFSFRIRHFTVSSEMLVNHLDTISGHSWEEVKKCIDKTGFTHSVEVFLYSLVLRLFLAVCMVLIRTLRYLSCIFSIREYCEKINAFHEPYKVEIRTF